MSNQALSDVSCLRLELYGCSAAVGKNFFRIRGRRSSLKIIALVSMSELTNAKYIQKSIVYVTSQGDMQVFTRLITVQPKLSFVFHSYNTFIRAVFT